MVLPEWPISTLYILFYPLDFVDTTGIELHVDRARYLCEIIFTMRILRPCTRESLQCLLEVTDNAIKGTPGLVILFSCNDCRFNLR